MNIDILSEAIIALGETKFSVRDIDNINFTDGNSKNLTKAQIQAKYDELLEADKKIQYQRDRAISYPSIQDVVVALAEKEEGDDTMWKEITAKRQKVKADNPKPE